SSRPAPRAMRDAKKKGRPEGAASCSGPAALLAAGGLADFHAGSDDLAVDPRQAVGTRRLVHAQGGFLALVAVGHVVADDLVLAAQRDALARLAVHALGAGGAVR